MSSAKTERLINLTMALLASRRFISKSEIFRRVAGYEGSQETKERMFERDKDDLRALGIHIEVGGHDPAFEDEPGYRILPERYQLEAESFTSYELSLISAALNLWQGSNFEASSDALLRRFESLGLPLDESNPISLENFSLDETGLTDIAQALASRRTIRFDYQKTSSSGIDLRRINPLGLSAWRGAWYVVGEDLDKGDIRAFKLSRIASSIEFLGKNGSYEIPPDFDVKEYLVMYSQGERISSLKLRKNRGFALRKEATQIKELNEEWDEINIRFNSEERLGREILWLGDDAIVVSPPSLRDFVVSQLNKVVDIYG